MANSAIGSADKAILRGNSFTKQVHVHITPLVSVFTSTIASVPTKSPYVQITCDDTVTGVSVGQMVKITSGSTLVSYAVVRKAPSGTTLYISTTPLGSAGYATAIETAIQAGQTVTVYSHRPLWGMYSTIRQRTFYKQWDIAYSDQNEDPPPVANAGAPQIATVAVGSQASFTLPRAGTNSSFAMAGSISSYSWSLPTGVSLKSGYALTDDVIQVDADAGRYLVSLTVTDSNANTHTAYVWLFVSDGTTGASLDERYPVSQISVNQTMQGSTGDLTLTGTSLDDVLYPGAMVVIKEIPYFENGTLTDGVFVDTHVGYIDNISYAYNEQRITTATVNFQSPAIYANNIVQPEQALIEKSSPSNWTQCTSTLSNPRGALYYTIKWHTPGLLDNHDFNASSFTTPRRKEIAYNTSNLGAAIQLVVALFLKHIGSAADGTTVMADRPMYMTNADRDSLAIRMSWQGQDFRLPLSYTRNLLSQIAETITGAFAYNGSKTKAWLAGKKFNQGTGSSELTNFTVTTSEGASRVAEVVGHFHAEQNRDILEWSFVPTANQDVIDCAYALWETVTIDSGLDPRGNGLSTARMLATRADRTWTRTAFGIEKTITYSFQPETFGQPGKIIPIGNVKTNATNQTPIAFTQQADEALGSLGLALAVNDVGQLAITRNYLATSPDWTDLSDLFEGDVSDFDWDYSSGFFTNGYEITEPLSAYVVSIDGTTLYVYRIEDVKTTLAVTDLTTVTMADSSQDYNARVVCSNTTPDLAIVVFKDQTGIEHTYTTDGGDTWSSKANIGNAITDTDNDDAHIGLDIFDETILVTAPDSTPEYGLYISTASTPSFSAVTNSSKDTTPMPMIKLIDDTNAYVSLPATTSGAIANVTFDAGGDSWDSITSNTSGAGEDTSGVGNPDDCARQNKTSVANIFLYVDFSFSSGTVDRVGFDYYGSTTTTVNVEECRVILKSGGSGGSSQYDSGWVSSVTLDGTWRNLVDTFSSVTADYCQVGLHLQATSSGDIDLRFDNIQVGNGTLADSLTYTLQKVSSLTGTSSWSDISPATDKAPVRPYDLAIDLADTDTINLVADNNNWYQSTNAGSSYTTKESSTTKRTMYSVGDAIMFGGTGGVDLTLDNGTNEDDKTGNLATAWGATGTIKRVLAL
jgi:hypothetical protein